MTKYICFTLFYMVIIANGIFAQPSIKRQKVIGGTSWDYLYATCLTKDSGLIVGGYSRSPVSGSKTEDPKGTDDYWIVKLNSAGAIQWDKTIGGTDGEVLTCLQQTKDKGYILGGYSGSDSSGDKTGRRRGRLYTTDYWIVKTDAGGNIEWDKTIGGKGNDELHAIAQTSDGGYILGGQSTSDSSYEKIQNKKGRIDYWIVKTDASGNIEWDKTIGGNHYDEFHSIKQTSDGGYILGGTSASKKSGDKTEPNRGPQGSFDYWIVKLNSAGTIEWDKTIGGDYDDVLFDLQQTKDNGYVLGGYSDSDISGEKTENSRGNNDYWLVKLNNAGNIQWDKTIGGSGNDYLLSLQQTEDEGYILGGYSWSGRSGEKTEDGKGFSDYWIIKLDKNANISWDKTIGSGGSDELRSVKEIKKNCYSLGGWSYGSALGDKTKSIGLEDYWIVDIIDKQNAVTAEKSAEHINLFTKNAEKDFSIYPNPVKDIGSHLFSGE